MAKSFSRRFYESAAWKYAREQALIRDQYLCVDCGKPAVEVHHKVELSPTNMGDVNVTLSLENLVCLCRNCHRRRHDKGGNEREMVYEFDENGYLVPSTLPPT